ncbi:hypothetical protein TspCOW1_01300 [Thiohalobacter sp. COW1]|uniref:hypothetical protein n=1 Tax=Thiohalobacter sp. COW1 TaxID=2795687 RepID=UPI001915003E|nr:hypothetical protein [Thiohalobacter sp. COW1]BCO30027.1 hypothetical protein TspCOW1_01300 [Thiohalobacter sp. COW1]
MTAETHHLEFDGYWREPNVGGIPAQSGIYCVYACRHNVNEKTVSLKRLIYIGESENVHERIAGHEKWPVWRRYLEAGQELSFSFAPITNSRVRVEAACIYEHKPPANTEYVDNFPYDTTTVITSGRNALLKGRFTAYPTGNSRVGYGLLSR